MRQFLILFIFLMATGQAWGRSPLFGPLEDLGVELPKEMDWEILKNFPYERDQLKYPKELHNKVVGPRKKNAFDFFLHEAMELKEAFQGKFVLLLSLKENVSKGKMTISEEDRKALTDWDSKGGTRLDLFSSKLAAGGYDHCYSTVGPMPFSFPVDSFKGNLELFLLSSMLGESPTEKFLKRADRALVFIKYLQTCIGVGGSLETIPILDTQQLFLDLVKVFHENKKLTKEEGARLLALFSERSSGNLQVAEAHKVEFWRFYTTTKMFASTFKALNKKYKEKYPKTNSLPFDENLTLVMAADCVAQWIRSLEKPELKTTHCEYIDRKELFPKTEKIDWQWLHDRTNGETNFFGRHWLGFLLYPVDSRRPTLDEKLSRMKLSMAALRKEFT